MSRINEVDMLGRIVVYTTKTGLKERGQVTEFDKATGVATIRLFIPGPGNRLVTDVPFSERGALHSWFFNTVQQIRFRSRWY